MNEINSTIQAISYTQSHYSQEILSLDSLKTFVNTKKNIWIRIIGLQNPEIIKTLCELLGIHALTVEDIFNTKQRPKFEDYPTYSYVVFNTISLDQSHQFQHNQISVIFTSDFIITFEKQPTAEIQTFITQLRNGLIHPFTPDYVATAILDATVDTYFLIIEDLLDEAHEIEENALTNAGNDLTKQTHFLRQNVLYFRKLVWPLQQALEDMRDAVPTIISSTTRPFLRNVIDHTIRSIAGIDSLRESLGILMETNIDLLNQKSNDIMKILTVIGAIFLPLSFIASAYGVNYKYLPIELTNIYSHMCFLGVYATIAIGALTFFKFKKWF